MIETKPSKIWENDPETGEDFVVQIVNGDLAFEKLRQPINEALKEFGVVIRFYWTEEYDGANYHVVEPPYAFFCKRTIHDDETDKEQNV